MDIKTYGWIKKIHEWMDGCINKKYGCMEKKDILWMDGYKDIWMDIKTYGWIKKIYGLGRPF